jgi:uncharacterized membrane protein
VGLHAGGPIGYGRRVNKTRFEAFFEGVFAFAFTLLAYCSSCYNLMLNHLVRASAFRDGITQALVRQTVHAYRMGWIVYLAATLLALLFPLLSFAAYIGIVIYYLVPRGFDADLDATGS